MSTKTKHYRFYLLLLVIIFFSQDGWAQVSHSEKRLSANQIPDQIVRFVKEHYPDATKSKYYKLTWSPDSILYEVKLEKPGKAAYDLIFVKEGDLLRTDEYINYKHVDETVRKKVGHDLSSRFSTYRILHCQRQRADHKLQYELKLEGKENRLTKQYLFVYTETGEYIHHKIIPEKYLGLIFH